MRIIDTAIRNRIAVVIVAVLLSVGGLFAYVTIPKESTPQIEIAMLVVTTLYPGASPSDIESIITQEIEREVSTISGIDVLRSVSNEGLSTVVIEFLPNVEVSDAKQEVREAVDRARTEFPTEVEDPIISEIDTSEFPVVIVNLAAPYSLAQLNDTAERLEDAIENVPGVLEVDIVGGIEREVQVNVDLAALQGYNLTFDDVTNAIQRENTNIPGGSMDLERQNYLVRVDGEFREPAEIETVVISAPDGRPVYIRDVADVLFGFKDRLSYSRLEVLHEDLGGGDFRAIDNPRNLQVISLVVKKRPGANIIQTIADVRAMVDGYPVPSGTEITYTGDQSEFVETLVKDLENNIIAALLFVVSVLLFFLGVRNAMLVGIAIPLSMFIAFILFAAIGQTLNFIILFSLIIALGMMLDNAVVIVENIYRFREQGHDRWEASRLASKEVAGAVSTATVTTVAAFVPMLFWPGVIGRFMSYLPLTLIATLSASLLVALVINPVVTAYLMRLDNAPTPRYPRFARRVGFVLVGFTALVVGLTNWRTLVFAAIAIPLVVVLHRRVLNPMALRFQERDVPRMSAAYSRFLEWSLQRDYSVPHAMLRNTFVLGCFTGGFLLLMLGGGLSAAAGAAGLILLVPGGLLLLVGILGVLVHLLEGLFLGGRKTIKAGFYLGIVLGVLVLLLWLGGRIESLTVAIALLSVPTVIVIVGMLGMMFKGDREHLILTDNRARLLTGTFSSLIVIVVMFQVAPTGVEFFPTTDPNQIQINLESPLGTNLEASNEVADEGFARIETLLQQNDAAFTNTRDILTQVGVGGDFMFGGGSSRPEQAQITLNMVDYAARAEPSPLTLIRIREQLQGIPGVTTTITRDQQGPPTGAPVNLEITGPDFGQLVAIASDIREMLEHGTTAADASGRPPLHGLVDITDNLDTGRPEFRIEVDRERAAAFGLSTRQVAMTVRSAVAGIEASKYRTGEDEYDITVRLRESDRASLESLRSLTIPHEGNQIPIVAVAAVETGSGLGAITRLSQQRVVTVSGDAMDGVNANELLGRVQAHIGPYVEALPTEYDVRYTGESEEQDESFGFLFIALLLGGALTSIILVAQFNSIKNPLIIMIATALGLLGVTLGLIITRTPFGLMTFIGVISLAGIMANNSIVLVDYIEQLRTRGLDKKAAVVEGGTTRFRPVLLTALTTIVGLIPLTFGINIDFVGLITNLDPALEFGGENMQFWGPMGTAIMSGLTFATFLTLIMVPVMYSTFDSVADLLGSKLRPTNQQPPAGETQVASVTTVVGDNGNDPTRQSSTAST